MQLQFLCPTFIIWYSIVCVYIYYQHSAFFFFSSYYYLGSYSSINLFIASSQKEKEKKKNLYIAWHWVRELWARPVHLGSTLGLSVVRHVSSVTMHFSFFFFFWRKKTSNNIIKKQRLNPLEEKKWLRKEHIPSKQHNAEN